MRDYYCKSILDEDCISVNELNCDNLILYCTRAAVPHKALIIRWLKTVGIEYRIIDFENTFDPVSGKPLGNFEYKEQNGYGWSNVDVYLFETYNIKLKDTFLHMFEDVSERIAEIKGKIRKNNWKAVETAAKIIISGRSGYVGIEEEYSDTLSITDDSIEYECNPYQPSYMNPIQKWSYKTNSPAFRKLFGLALKATREIFERDPKCPGTDMPETEFSVIYHNNETVQKVFLVSSNEFSECFSILRKMVPPCELMPCVLQTGEDYRKERLWHTVLLQ